jgi:hypothetical protein
MLTLATSPTVKFCVTWTLVVVVMLVVVGLLVEVD